jgi:hypothetical protein
MHLRSRVSGWTETCAVGLAGPLEARQDEPHSFVRLKASVAQLVGCVRSWLQHMTGIRALLCVVMATSGELFKPLSV